MPDAETKAGLSVDNLVVAALDVRQPPLLTSLALSAVPAVLVLNILALFADAVKQPPS